jgi:succinate dehydrogenase / fumarate reductase cytochrome b subunit
MKVITCKLCSFWESSIGKKLVVALTGLFLTLFLAGHLTGNLLIYVGAEAFDAYAHFLHHMLHGAGIWLFRISMLVALILHVVATVQLTRANRTARQQYECKATVRASRSSRIMIWSGLTILAFVIFHILHLTVRIDPILAELAEKSPHAMAIRGFQSWPVVIFYVIAMTLLCSHLSHGVASIFQTLGFRTAKTAGPIQLLSTAYALIIWLGFISIPLAIVVGIVK